MKIKKLTAVVTALAVALTVIGGTGIISRADNCGGLEEKDVIQPATEKGDVVRDPVLHWAIRSAMNAVTNHDMVLTQDILENSGIQYVSFEQNNHPDEFVNWQKQYWIEDLEGIQYIKTAKMINICYSGMVDHQINDVSPLAPLTQLETLMLKQNRISDISSLETLVNLRTFDVSGNQISDISAVAGMNSLKELNVASNQISDINVLSGLENLESVDVSGNQITTLPDMSKWTKVTSFHASNNQLVDVSGLAKLIHLKSLDLAGNAGITDVKALAGLIYLEKENTYLPNHLSKDDLFAAIEVNKLFDKFNISRMKASDLENVEKALAAFDALSDEQKTYMDRARMDAARSNKERVEKGEDPVYYPEYDHNGSEKLPVWDRVTIKVVDKNGNPMPGVNFIKTRKTAYKDDKSTVETDGEGDLNLIHSSTDGWYDEIVIKPLEEDYVAEPESISYAVLNMATDLVNGKKATGLEELSFVLVPKNEYVDKAQLSEALKAAKTVGESYKYTQESYQQFEIACQEAQKIYDDVNASQETVNKAADDLKKTMQGLTKKDILTQLKITVKDKNGNPFTRPFKFQIRKSRTDATGAFNIYADGYANVAYLQASPGWTDGQSWIILACEEEPYNISPITVSIGVKNGQRYFKTVNGVNVNVDFEQAVTIIPSPNGAVNKEKERKPDSTVLAEYVAEAKKYKQADYTPASWKNLQDAIAKAEEMIQKTNASQEDYNASAAELKQAEKALVVVPDKTALKEEINLEFSVSEAGCTKTAWERYQTELSNAKKVDADVNASQEQVDEALEALKSARLALGQTAKEELETALAEAKGIEKGDYTSATYDALQKAIAKAEEVAGNPAATDEEMENAVRELTKAKKALKKIVLPFTDVPYEGEWYSNAVKYVYDNQIMTGLTETTFGPYETLARAQFAVIIHRMSGSPEVEYKNTFPDVEKGTWYTNAVLWANKNEIITGYGHNGMFGPADLITREQMAVIMYRYAKAQGYNVSQKADFSKFKDAGSVSGFAEEAMKWAVGMGIISGKDEGTRIDPQGYAARAECAVIIDRFMEKYR